MAAQTSYSINQELAYPGLIYAQSPHDIVSRNVATVSGIPFGVAVSRVLNVDSQIGIGGGLFLGITIRSLDKEGAANTGAIQWNEKEAAGVLRAGYIWVLCSTGCQSGNTVKYNNTTGVLGDNTLFPAGVGETVINGATWESSGSIPNTLEVVRLR